MKLLAHSDVCVHLVMHVSLLDLLVSLFTQRFTSPLSVKLVLLLVIIDYPCVQLLFVDALLTQRLVHVLHLGP